MSQQVPPISSVSPTADGTTAAPPRPRRKSPVRLPVVLLTLALVAVLCVLGYYQDEVAYFMNLKLWDQGGPARTVRNLLQACSQGNVAEAKEQVDPTIQPLEKNGKWIGFFVHDPHFNRDTNYPFSRFVPKDPSAQGQTEFVLRGEGAAMVTVTGPTGQPEKFHLSMEKGSWKVDQIL